MKLIFSAQVLKMVLTDTVLHDKLSSTAAVRAAEFSPDRALRDSFGDSKWRS